MNIVARNRLGSMALTAVALSCLHGVASAQNTVVLKNDGFPDNLLDVPAGTTMEATAFNFGEELNVWLTSPCEGNIVELQILWGSQGYTGPTVEQELGLYEAGAFPNRSVTALTQPGWGDVVLLGPQMTAPSAGLANVISFQHVDENQTVPMQVPVSAGQTFVVSFEFGTDWCNDYCAPNCFICTTFTGAFIPSDALGCTPGRNGIFGPPSGQDFCNLGGRGNFVVRAIVECASGDGACCLPDGSCQVMSDTECASSQGLFQGIGRTCGEVTCTELIGACCIPDDCLNTTQNDCENIFSGTWLGPNEDCNVNDPCGLNTTGACCLGDNTCIEVGNSDCTAQGGTYQGNGTGCDFIECDPIGACCTGPSECFSLQLKQSDCIAAGGSWKGAGTNCVSDPSLCIPVGACCFDTGFCLNDVTEADCLSVSTSVWLGEGVACNPDTTCPNLCPADCGNIDGAVDIEDLLDLLSQWGSTGGCDVVPVEGDGMVDINDLLELLAAWGQCP